MQVEDLDGNVLRFGSEPIAGAPFGEWLDMHGRIWPPGGGDAGAGDASLLPGSAQSHP